MDSKTCQCIELKWECWIKEYDSNNPDLVPGLWFSIECASCGEMKFFPHAEVDESSVPKEILARGMAWLKRQREKESSQTDQS